MKNLYIKSAILALLGVLSTYIAGGKVSLLAMIMHAFAGFTLVILAYEWRFKEEPISMTLAALGFFAPLLTLLALITTGAEPSLIELVAKLNLTASFALSLVIVIGHTLIQAYQHGFISLRNYDCCETLGCRHGSSGFYGASGIFHSDDD